MKIGFKLILSFLLFVLVIVFVGYVSSNITQNSLLDFVQNRAQHEAKRIINKIDEDIYKKIEVFQEYATQSDFHNIIIESNQKYKRLDNIEKYIDDNDKQWILTPKNTITPFMQSLIGNKLSEQLREKMNYYAVKYGQKIFAEIIVTNKYGANVAQTGKTSDFRQNDEVWWYKARNNYIYTEDVQFDESANVYSVDFGLRINDKQGNFIGVMKIVLNLNDIIETIKTFKNELKEEYSPHSFTLLTHDGRIIYSSNNYKILQKASDDKIEILNHNDNVQHNEYTITKNMNKPSELLVWAHSRGYKDFNGFNWLLIINYEVKDIFSPIDNLNFSILMASFAGIILTIIISTYVSKSITGPLKKLSKAAIEIGKGHFDTIIEFKSSDEIGQLADSFHKMSKELQETTVSKDFLEISNIKLQNEVAERILVESKLENTLSIQKLVNSILYLSLTKYSLKIIMQNSLDLILSSSLFDKSSQGAIFLADRISEHLDVYVRHNMSNEITKCNRVKYGYCLCGQSASKSEALYSHCNKEEIYCCCNNMEEHGHYCIPIIFGKEILGVISVVLPDNHMYNEHVVSMLTTVSATFASIIKRSHTEEELEDSYRRLKSVNDELKLNQEQLVQSEKMASIGQLAAGVAHEINNPVGFVLSNITSLNDYIKSLILVANQYKKLIDEPSNKSKFIKESINIWEEEDIEYILNDMPQLIVESQSGLERIRDIVADLKSFARTDDASKKESNINDGIEKTLNIVANELKYKCKLVKDLKPLPKIICFPEQLNQVFANILVNASQAIKEHGTITIKTYYENNNIFIKISDTGTGISKENIKKLFDPFFTTKDVGKGTGLGLSISHGIIKKHDGTIEVESELGKGTTFIIKLPISGALNG